MGLFSENKYLPFRAGGKYLTFRILIHSKLAKDKDLVCKSRSRANLSFSLFKFLVLSV